MRGATTSNVKCSCLTFLNNKALLASSSVSNEQSFFLSKCFCWCFSFKYNICCRDSHQEDKRRQGFTPQQGGGSCLLPSSSLLGRRHRLLLLLLLLSLFLLLLLDDAHEDMRTTSILGLTSISLLLRTSEAK